MSTVYKKIFTTPEPRPPEIVEEPGIPQPAISSNYMRLYIRGQRGFPNEFNLDYDIFVGLYEKFLQRLRIGETCYDLGRDAAITRLGRDSYVADANLLRRRGWTYLRGNAQDFAKLTAREALEKIFDDPVRELVERARPLYVRLGERITTLDQLRALPVGAVLVEACDRGSGFMEFTCTHKIATNKWCRYDELGVLECNDKSVAKGLAGIPTHYAMKTPIPQQGEQQ